MKKIALLSCLAISGIAEANALTIDNPAYQQGNINQAQAPAPADNALYDILSRVEQLQLEVQQLRGVVEEQSQTIADLERKQRNMYSDLDGRVQALTPATGQTAVAQTPAPVVNAPAAVPTPMVVPTVTGNVQQPAVATPPIAAVAAPAVVATPPAPSLPIQQAKVPEKERFQLAYDALRNGRNDQAIKLFESQLSDYPVGELADTSQYWLGEAYKMNRDFDKSRVSFNKLVNQYPNSAKVPDALFKLGEIEFDAHNYPKAREYLSRVASTYPASTAAHLAAKKLALLPQ